MLSGKELKICPMSFCDYVTMFCWIKLNERELSATDELRCMHIIMCSKSSFNKGLNLAIFKMISLIFVHIKWNFSRKKFSGYIKSLPGDRILQMNIIAGLAWWRLFLLCVQKQMIDVMAVSFFSHICMFCFGLIVDTQTQESTLGGGVNRHCFYGLETDSEYRISVYTKLQEIEGPSVSIMQRTRKSDVFSWSPSIWANGATSSLCSEK